MAALNEDYKKDACAASLHDGKGDDVRGQCKVVLTDQMKTEAMCLADKIGLLGVPYPGPSGKIRNSVYQAHLKEVYEKDIDLRKLNDPKDIQACAALRIEVDVELAHHGRIRKPAKPGSSKHETGETIDVPEQVVEALKSKTLDRVEEYVRSPLPNPPGACNLRWGGNFKDEYDPVHFELL